MQRQPPAFLERLVGRLIPAASREHVLGDLAERYRSSAQYLFDAGRVIPFVLHGQFRRSGLLTAWLAGTGLLQIGMVGVLLGILHASVELERGVRAPGWFWLAFLLFLLLFSRFLSRPIAGIDNVSGNPEKRAILRRIDKVERRSRVSAVPASVLGALPFLHMAAANMNGRPTPVFDGRLIEDAVALVVLALCLGWLEHEQYRRELRKLRQQLEQA